MKFKQLEHHEVQNFTINKNIILFIESISSPENIGGIFRVAEAMGVQKIYWKDSSIDFYNKKITKIARNTNQKVTFEKVSDYTVLKDLQSQGFKIVALELTTNAQNIHQASFSDKIVLILGNEIQGVSEEALELCSVVYFIPMYGENSSMNLVVSLGIALNLIA
ncbi:MAG: TrmH family RNA methyltransferase [Flavobacteriales bacterium]